MFAAGLGESPAGHAQKAVLGDHPFRAPLQVRNGGIRGLLLRDSGRLRDRCVRRLVYRRGGLDCIRCAAAFRDRTDQAAKEQPDRRALKESLRPAPCHGGAHGPQFLRQNGGFGIALAKQVADVRRLFCSGLEHSLVLRQGVFGGQAAIDPTLTIFHRRLRFM